VSPFPTIALLALAHGQGGRIATLNSGLREVVPADVVAGEAVCVLALD